MTNDIKCPLCNNSSVLLYHLNRNKIATELTAFTGRRFSPELIKTDYDMFRCQCCSLEFSHPMLPGDEVFYTELTSNSGYYPEVRSEYAVACEIILKHSGADSSVIDIGCGAGDFLLQAVNSGIKNAEGIDATPSSVELCRSKGLNVCCKRIEDLSDSKYDAVVSFHCLEHVADPLEFVRQALHLLKPGGVLLISTPYSPQVIEYFWFHPLNHPPHHTIRLNKKSFEKLAELTGTRIEFYNFHNTSLISHIRSCFSYSVYKINAPGSSIGVFMKMLVHPVAAFKSIVKVFGREKINGKIAGPDIMVQFKSLK
jgi:2-polyprenyl-3-methyl-5-hydroxy-6-metoxy-1,4-benzoquinol methylase